jgi:hypothetical protein
MHRYTESANQAAILAVNVNSYDTSLIASLHEEVVVETVMLP